jgi:antirestriction protein
MQYIIYVNKRKKACRRPKQNTPHKKTMCKGDYTMTNERTQVFLNTWGLYNMSVAPNKEHGYLGYGWMTATEAKNFIEENPERDGGEWFIADIDNYLGIKLAYNYDYCDVLEVLETIETLEDMEDWERQEVIALMELNNFTVSEAIEQKDNYTFYSDVDEYFDICDECLDFSGCNEILERYFDYEAYHRDCMFDATECSNGVVIAH